MLVWIANHFKTIITIVGTGLIGLFGFFWTFILMGYETKAETERNKAQIVSQQLEINSLRIEQAQAIGVIKSVKDGTQAIRDILYKQALRKSAK